MLFVCIAGLEMNGYGGGSEGQVCCLLDNGARCTRQAGNASYNKRIQKTVQQRRLKLTIEHSVSTCMMLRSLIHGLHLIYVPPDMMSSVPNILLSTLVAIVFGCTVVDFLKNGSNDFF